MSKQDRRNMRERLSEIQKRLLPEIEVKMTAVRQKLSSHQKEKNVLEKEAVDLTNMLTPKIVKDPAVSDHALVRYMERVKGFDLEAIRNEILTEDRKQQILAGAKAIKVGNSKFKIEGNVVVTIV